MCIIDCPCRRCGDNQTFCNDCPNRPAGPAGNNTLGTPPNTHKEG